jgi:hypothetical protein
LSEVWVASEIGSAAATEASRLDTERKAKGTCTSIPFKLCNTLPKARDISLAGRQLTAQ